MEKSEDIMLIGSGRYLHLAFLVLKKRFAKYGFAVHIWHGGYSGFDKLDHGVDLVGFYITYRGYDFGFSGLIRMDRVEEVLSNSMSLTKVRMFERDDFGGTVRKECAVGADSVKLFMDGKFGLSDVE